MKHAVILYDEVLKDSESLDLTRKVFGPAKTELINKKEGHRSDYSCIFYLITQFCRDVFLHQLNEISKEEDLLPVGVFYIGDDESMYQEILNQAKNRMGFYLSWYDFLPLSPKEPDLAFKKILADKLITAKRKLADTSDMPYKILEDNLKNLLASHNTCSLNTGFDGRLRSTPIEYSYVNGCLYFLSEGGEKFANIYINSNVGITIYHEFSGFSKLEGLQIEGVVYMVELFSDEYVDIVNMKGLSPSKLKELPVPLHMFKVKPVRIQILKSEFGKEGYKSKQIWELHNYSAL